MLGSMRWLYELISRLHGTGQTVVVARVNAFGARIAQEKLGVPLVSVHLQPVIFRSEHDAPGLPLPEVDHPVMRYPRRLLWASIDLYVDLVLTPGLNAFRSELGLAPIRRPFQRWIHSPELVVGLFPDWFGPPQSDWPPNTHLTGFPLFDESSVRKVPSELESFLAAGAPPVVFTRGSQTQGARDFFDTSVKICRLTGHRGVLLTPSRVAVPGALPETVCHFDYVPFGAVFPRAAAVVHHGGIGTTGLALAGGVPQIVVPLFDDQSDNAARVQRLGAGVRVSPRAYRPKAVARKLERLLDSDEVAGACRSLAARIKGHDPLPDVCRLIEDVGARRR